MRAEKENVQKHTGITTKMEAFLKKKNRDKGQTCKNK